MVEGTAGCTVSAPSSRRTPLRVAPLGPEVVPEDGDLADALIAGEAWAATATYRKHGRMILRFLDRALGPSGDAEDLTHEVFVCLFSKVRGLRDRNAFRSFMFSIAVRVLKRELRRRRVRRLFNVSGIDQFPEPSAIEFDVEARQALRRLYAILDRLNAQERSAFVLRHVEGMSLDEVALALGVSLATVKRRLQRATRTVSQAADCEPSLGRYSGGARGGSPGVPLDDVGAQR